MNDLVPFVLERKVVPKVWGGRGMEEVLGIALPPGETVGEAWEVYDRPDSSSPIRGSDLTLHQVLKRDPVALLGAGVSPTREGRFPIAIKFLDAQQTLSVQVHPDDDQAAEEGDSGKSEAWLVLRTGPRAGMRRGFRAGVTFDEFAAVADREEVVELLEATTPAAGDTVHIPPGTVHTLGPDVLVFEIQSNSGVTYRLFDWGRDRALHVEKGIRAARCDVEPQTVVPPVPTDDGGEWLLRDPRFRLRRYRVGQARTFQTHGSFKIITLLSGFGVVGWRSQGEDEPLQVRQADSIVIPACVDEVYFSPIGDVSVVVSSAGEGV